MVLESWGRGIKLMVDECRRVGIPDQEFHADSGFVWVVFHYTRITVGYNPTVMPQVEKVIATIGTNVSSAKEIMEQIGLKDKKNLLENYIYPAIELKLVEPLYPESPKHPKQKYFMTDKGKELLKQ